MHWRTTDVVIRSMLIVGSWCASLAPSGAMAEPRDPLLPMLRRIDEFFHGHEVDGVTLDARYPILPSEVARLSGVSQLLGYAELQRACPTPTFREDVVQRADFLLARFDEITSGTSFDGMLGYALLEAYEIAADPRYLASATTIVLRLESLLPHETILNGGLMAALALAKYHQLTDDDASERRAREILASLPAYQNADGSFPHWCPGSKDVHYTGWMAMELILIERIMDDPLIDPMLARMRAFLEGRVDATGNTRYQETCPTYPGCVEYYYSIATGCGIDYDTRAFPNELGYTALLFDHFRSHKYETVMRFFRSLEHHGVFADKWDFWPPPSDPYYPWTIADTSVVNMSVIFWSLASLFRSRTMLTPGPYAWPDAPDSVATEPLSFTELPTKRPTAPGPSTGIRAAISLSPVIPNPTRGACRVRFATPGGGAVSLAVYDAAGRSVRRLASQRLGSGEHEARWDLRDEAGLLCRGGLYWIGLRVGEETRSVRVLVLR